MHDLILTNHSKFYIIAILAIVFSCSYLGSFAQDENYSFSVPDKLSAAVGKRISGLEKKMIKGSLQTLHQLQHQEEKIIKKQLLPRDSLQAKVRLEKIKNEYKELEQKLRYKGQTITAGTIKNYIPYLDTLKTAFKFLDQQGLKNVGDAFTKINSLEGLVQQAEEIKKIIRERREFLTRELEQLGLARELKRFNKGIYYYSAQLNEYKLILSNPRKIERKAIESISKTKLFRGFMKKNSMLATLFRLPGDADGSSYRANLAGLQSRSQVNNLIQQQIASGGANAQDQIRQNIQQAQSQLQQLKNKVEGLGNSDAEIPDFKPNSQKTKRFLQRLELGVNIQSQKASNFFPATSDLGLSIGYKLNDKSVAGIGASYKLGLGGGWNHIRFTGEGNGYRSFIDWKIKGSFWLTGGYEMNHLPGLEEIDVSTGKINAWQQSGLIGLSKTVSLKTKFFQKTKLQLLWDFLSYRQMPAAQPLKFRIGYSIK